MDKMSAEKIYRFPKRSYVSHRDGRWLYFSADAGSGAVVNKAGSEVLEACRKGGAGAQIARRLVRENEDAAPVISRIIEPFLESMVERGFLAYDAVSNTGAAESGRDRSNSQGAAPELDTLYIHVTDRCNLRCVYCYNSDQRNEALQRCKNGSARELGRDEFISLLDQASALGASTAIFTGGEPLLHPDVCNLGNYAKTLGMSTNLLTNGSLITGENASHLVAAFDSVIVSLDSFIKSEHESMRPGASFESVVSGIKHLAAANVKSLAIRPVISNTNLQSLPFFPAYAKQEFGCNTWSVANCIPNSPEELEQLDRFVDPEKYQAIMEKFRRALEDGAGSMVKDEYALEGAGACGAAGSILSVSATGDVYPCQNLHHPEYWGGNIREQSLEAILLYSDVFAGFRKAKPPWFDGCSQCALITVCASMCRVYYHTFKNRRRLFYEKMCPMLRADLDGKLWREAEKSRGLTQK